MKSATEFLGRICEIESGGTPLRSRREYYGGGIPWVKISDISACPGLVTKTEETLTTEGLRAIRGRLFPVGTVLLAMYGSIGKVAVAGVELSTNQAILGIGIKDKARLDARYLVHWLEHMRGWLTSRGNGVAQQNISAGMVRSLKIPLPKLEEQLRISSTLDRVSTLRQKYLEAGRECGNLLEVLSRDAFARLKK